MNSQFRKLADGSLMPSVDLHHWDGVKHHAGRVRVYWPFVVFEIAGPKSYNVTHAPTGRHVIDTPTLKAAVAKIHALREAADFDFRSARGAKAKRAQGAVMHLIPRLTRIA